MIQPRFYSLRDRNHLITVESLPSKIQTTTDHPCFLVLALQANSRQVRQHCTDCGHNHGPRQACNAASGARREHVCERCHKSYGFFSSLWRHRTYECGVEPRFACHVCSLRFAQKGTLQRHMRSRHSSEAL